MNRDHTLLRTAYCFRLRPLFLETLKPNGCQLLRIPAALYPQVSTVVTVWSPPSNGRVPAVLWAGVSHAPEGVYLLPLLYCTRRNFRSGGICFDGASKY